MTSWTQWNRSGSLFFNVPFLYRSAGVILWREGLHHKMKFSQASLSFLVFKPSSERTQNPVTVTVVTKAGRLQGPRQTKSLRLQGLSWHCVSATNSTGTHVVLRHHVIQTPLEYKNYGPDFFLFLFKV